MSESEPTHVLPKGIELAELARRKKELNLPQLLGETPALLFRPWGDEQALYLTPDGGEPMAYPRGASATSVLKRGEIPAGDGSLERSIVVVMTPTSRNLHEDQILVGRALTNDIRVISPQVSKVHARFLYEEGEWKLMDAGSSNGTLINGIKLEPDRSYGLRPGDEILIGDLQVLFVDAEGLVGLTNLVSDPE
jgi:hypothetical protein